MRNLRRQKTFTIINVVGMALGMAVFMILTQSAGQKLNADRFHENAGRIYGVVQVLPTEDKAERHTVSLPAPLLSALKNDFPEVEAGTRAVPGGQRILRRGDRSFYERRILFVDPEFLSIFNFPMSSGSPAGFLTDPRSIVLSKAAAAKYFGDEDPLGEILTIDNKVDLTVAGVARDLPRTSSLRFDILIPFETLRTLGADIDDWRTDLNAVFLLARRGFDEAAFEAKLPAFVDRHFAVSSDLSRRMYLLPFLDFRLKASHIESFLPSSQPVFVVFPFVLGVLLLLIVSVNFINLSTVRHLHRMKEIGLRKVVGARRAQIVVQLIGESVLLALVALPFSVLLFEIINPIVSNYMRVAVAAAGVGSMSTSVSDSILSNPYLLKYAFLAALLTGIFSGLHPALYLASFHPVQILKGSVRPGRKKRRGSKIMIGFQFTAAVVFIAFAGITKSQTRSYIRADFGFDRERVATLAVPSELRPKMEALQTEIARNPQVLSVSASAGLPLIWTDDRPARPLEKDPEESVSFDAYGVGFGFTETLGIEILEGRSFSRDSGNRNGFIINEAAASKLGWADPVGRILVVGDRTGPVIGVAKDFLFDDLGFAIPPAVFMIDPDNLNHLLVKYSPSGSFPELRDDLARKWDTFAPGVPFECLTLEERFDTMFELLRRMASFLNGLGLTIVFFSCLGLLGLSTFALERRTKEVGIRKILGASLERISWSLGREFFIPVAVANSVGLVLITVGWRMIMKTGLLFITGIGFGTYIVAVGVSFAAAFLAVATQTVKAALAKPVESLRVE
ncbi:MAG: ABC transporter permease [Candidatus Aminicenantes bacterium]|nr:ABC transporter permease [Candidatus Aminicenantes bacterium]